MIAGALVGPETEQKLLDAGVKDSKRVSDTRATALARLIRQSCPCTVVTIGPEKYNELIDKMPNLNALMGWGHARVIENLLEKVDCSVVISDKFGKDQYIENALQKRGRTITLIQRTKAESDTAVAAASILARDTFLTKMDQLSDKFGMELPRGAGDRVIHAAREFVAKHGKNALGQVVKLHFKTTKSVL